MEESFTIGIAVIGLIMVIIIIAEVLWIRNRRLKRRLSTGTVKRGKYSLRDDAHNALVTGRAIARTLERSGASMSGAWSQLEEAQLAFDRGNYRVCIEIVDRAKDTMKSSRLAQERKGDLAKLESSAPSSQAEDEVLTKEYIAKELPENFVQAKFSLNLARDHMEECRKKAMDTEAAALVLSDAEKAFDEKDYTTALKLAIRCKNLLGDAEGGLEIIPPDEEVIEITEEQLKNRCEGCGELLVEGDSFCRKCGSKIPKARKCEKCNKVANVDDKFCRGCGSELPS